MSAHPRRKSPIAIIAILLSVITLAVLAITSGSKPFSENTQAIAEASASVVTIYTYDINNVNLGSGSGFAAIEEGLIVTNYHVIGGDTYRIEAVTESGVVMEADSVVAYDKDKDIAILRFYDCKLHVLPTADGMSLDRGASLTTIGSPIGFNNMVSIGVLSQYLKITDTDIVELLFTASISHGSSGGALFDENGNVVGITSGAYTYGNDIYYAIPFLYVTELYKNRTVGDEITPAKLWEQTEHTYTVDYVMAYPRQLNGKTIELVGYTSAVYHDLYLQASPERPITIQSVSELSSEEKTLLEELIWQKRKDGSILMCQRESRGSFDSDLLGKRVTLRGKVTVYGENTSGVDVRFIVSEVVAKE